MSETDLPVVSVIIPNYNHAAYLEQRIDSVLEQTYQDFELIILDDCSTDNSRTIIEQYRTSKKIRDIIYNEANSGGPFKQWEKGILLARGKYIWIAESDDWCEPTLLEYLVEGLENNENCAISHCQSYYMLGANTIKWQSQYPLLSDYMNGKEYLKKHMVYSPLIFNASMAIWRKGLFPQVSKEFMGYKFCGDWLFWLQLCCAGDVFITGRVLNYFRNHPGDVSTKAYKSGLNFIEETRVLNKLYTEKLIPDKMYRKAWRKKHREFWNIKPLLDKKKVTDIEHSFYNQLSPNTSVISLKADAWWKNFRTKLKALFKKQISG